jgi:hypothetical protein
MTDSGFWRGVAALLTAGGLLAAQVRAVPPPGYEPADEGHIDFVFCYVGGVWNTGLVWDSTGNPVHGGPAVGTFRPAKMVPVVARDQPYAEGSRSRRPAGQEWDFLGVAEGEPFWWFPQIRTGAAWPGFVVCGDCDPYFEDDPRVMAASTWKTLDLKRVRYRGRGKGNYALWSTGTFGELTVWMSTADGGITVQDKFFVSSAGHAHAAMGFSDLGLYEVTYTATCYSGPGKTLPVTSPEVSFYFAVGTYWEWVARHFQPERWWEPVSLESADADGDSIPNLVEYGCGLDPRTPDLRTHERGSLGGGLPGLQLNPVLGWGAFHFVMRAPSSNSQVQAVVESSTVVGAGHWNPEWSMEEAVGGGWGAMAYGFNLPPLGPPDRVFRLSLTLQDNIEYDRP